MGFGLHVGWGIEGAIGSFYKIDCSYLSPNVNIAARLETATNIYGVDILLSGELYSMLSNSLQSKCRLIDCVTLKGSNNTSLPMNYQIGLEVNKNTFNAGYLSYSLTNTVNEGGTPVSNVSNYALPLGQSTVTFGVGQFKTGQDVKHTYKLEIFFKDNENNQNVGGQEAEFDAKIIMKEAGTWPDRRLVEW